MMTLFNRLFRRQMDYHFTKEQVRSVVRHEARKQIKELWQEVTIQNAAVLIPRIEALEKIVNEK